ncbi:MAG: hypothetical protein ACOH1T_03135 [Microbacteriaceae bacterium]
MLGRDKLGGGKDARFHTFERSGSLTGARFVVRRAASDAVALAVEKFVAAGFAVRDDNLDARLREAGSPWVARAVEIGDAKGSWKKGIIADLIEDTPLVFLTRMQRGISPTLVMVTARALPDGTTELIFYPHASTTGDPEGWAGAAERIRNSAAEIANAFASEATLVSHEKMNGILNDGSPASQEMVRTLLNWK